MEDNEGYGREAQLAGLLREVRRQAWCESGPGVGKILDWLHQQTGVDAAVIAEDAGTVESSTAGFPRTVLVPLAGLLARLSGGHLAAAATQVEALHVRCEALGPHGPRPVLVVVSRSEPTSQTVALTSHTGSVLALLRQAEAGDRTRRVYHDKARQLRFAVLHGLLAGGPLLARRMTTGAVPPLLDADRLRIHLLRCPSADRDRIAQSHQDSSGYQGPALMVHCPVFKEHLICRREDEAWGWEPSREMMHHRWRHTYASVQLGAGEDPVSVSHWMGHASVTITLETYAHFLPDNGMRGRTAMDAWLDNGAPNPPRQPWTYARRRPSATPRPALCRCRPTG